MQVNKQNVQRPSLIDYSSTIDCTIKSLNIVHKKSVTSDSHNIQELLKNSKNQHSALIIVGKFTKKVQRLLRTIEESGSKNKLLRDELRQLNKIRNYIRCNPQSHNDISSLM